MEANLHHLYWNKADWQKYTLSNSIRTHQQSKQIMEVGTHRELHVYCRPIEPLSAPMARIVLANLSDIPRHYGALDTAKALRDDLYDTVPDISEHLGRQIPFMELSARALRTRSV